MSYSIVTQIPHNILLNMDYITGDLAWKLETWLNVCLRTSLRTFEKKIKWFFCRLYPVSHYFCYRLFMSNSGLIDRHFQLICLWSRLLQTYRNVRKKCRKKNAQGKNYFLFRCVQVKSLISLHEAVGFFISYKRMKKQLVSYKLKCLHFCLIFLFFTDSRICV